MTDTEDVSLVFAEHVARDARAWTMWLVWLFAANLVLPLVGVLPMVMILGCAFWAGLALQHFGGANSVLRLTTQPDAMAMVCGRQLIVRSGRGEQRLCATKRQLASARRHALPAARAYRLTD